MLTKIEITGFLSGTIGIFFMLTLLFNHQKISPLVFEFFRGGNAGAILVGIAIKFGFFAILLLVTNLIIGNRARWQMRIMLCFTFIIATAFLGSYE